MDQKSKMATMWCFKKNLISLKILNDLKENLLWIFIWTALTCANQKSMMTTIARPNSIRKLEIFIEHKLYMTNMIWWGKCFFLNFKWLLDIAKTLLQWSVVVIILIICETTRPIGTKVSRNYVYETLYKKNPSFCLDSTKRWPPWVILGSEQFIFF